MKINKLKERLSKDRAMTSITIRMPEDVIESLKKQGVKEAAIEKARVEAGVVAG